MNSCNVIYILEELWGAVWFNWKYRYTLFTSLRVMLSFVMWKYSHTLYHSSVVVLYSSKWKYKHTLLNNGMLILNETWDRGISTWLYHWGSNNLPVLEEFAALCVGNLKYRKIDILASHFTYINTCHTSHFRLCVGNISRIIIFTKSETIYQYTTCFIIYNVLFL